MEDPKSCEFFTKQFQKKRFLFSYEEPSLLATAQCGNFQILYVIYRFLWLAFWAFVFIYDLVGTGDKNTWIIYLTNLSYTLVFISTILQFIAAVYQLVRGDKAVEKDTPLFYQITWIVYTFSSVSALIVTLLYWSALYPGSGAPLSFTNIATHLLNSVYVIIDVFVCGTPVRLLHFYLTSAYALLYAVFSLIYWAAGGSAIYQILDWSTGPGTAAGLVLGVILVGAPLLQLVLFCLYWLRMLLYTYVLTCCGSKRTGVISDGEKIEGGTAVISDEEKMEGGKVNPAYQV